MPAELRVGLPARWHQTVGQRLLERFVDQEADRHEHAAGEHLLGVHRIGVVDPQRLVDSEGRSRSVTALGPLLGRVLRVGQAGLRAAAVALKDRHLVGDARAGVRREGPFGRAAAAVEVRRRLVLWQLRSVEDPVSAFPVRHRREARAGTLLALVPDRHHVVPVVDGREDRVALSDQQVRMRRAQSQRMTEGRSLVAVVAPTDLALGLFLDPDVHGAPM